MCTWMWHLAYELLLLGGVGHVADVVEELSKGLLRVRRRPGGAVLHTGPLAGHHRDTKVGDASAEVHVILRGMQP